MKTLNPYLNFAGNTEEAFTFYRSVFGGEFVTFVRFRDFGDNTMGVPAEQLDRVAHVGLPIGDSMLMGTDLVDGVHTLEVGNNVHILAELDSAAEADRVFEGLGEGGSVQMPMQRTEWAEKYGSCRDRFGILWMVSYTGDVVFQADAAAAEGAR